MKLSDVVNAYLALSQMSTEKMNVKASYAIAKNIRKLEPEYKNYEEIRKKLFDQYSILDKEGNKVIPKEKQEEANSEFQTLTDIDVVVESYKIHLSDFGQFQPTPAQLVAIYFLLVEESDSP